MKFKDIFLLPNIITLARLFTTIFLFFTYSYDDFSMFSLVLIVSLIGISDAIDGIVARKLDQVSKIGIVLDPVSDRVVFLLLLFWLSNLFPSWFFYGILTREILVIIGSLYVLFNTKTLKVSKYGKIGTVFVFITICFFIINRSFDLILFDIFGILSLFFYYFVALEYLYKIIRNE